MDLTSLTSSPLLFPGLVVAAVLAWLFLPRGESKVSPSTPTNSADHCAGIFRELHRRGHSEQAKAFATDIWPLLMCDPPDETPPEGEGDVK